MKSKTKAEIGKLVVKTASESVKAIRLNSVMFGFFLYDILMPMLMDNRDELAQKIIDPDTKNGSEETIVSELISHLREEKKRVIDEILDEISEEKTIFDDNMKLDEINFHGKVPSMDRKRSLLLFTYVRLYRKLGNALRWTLLTDDGEDSEPNAMGKQHRGILLDWSDKLVDRLTPALIRKAEQNKFKSAAKWFEILCQMEDAIELANFGILFILPHDTWQSVGVERPTTVPNLFEKIGRTRIFEQIDDSFCDISCIEEMMDNKLRLLEPLNKSAVLEKMKKIAKEMVAELMLFTTIKVPSKIIFFNKVLHPIHTELASPEFSQLLKTKSSKVKSKLAEERLNGLAFLEKCSEILGEKQEEHVERVQSQFNDFSKLIKGRAGGKMAKSDGREGTSKEPIAIVDDE